MRNRKRIAAHVAGVAIVLVVVGYAADRPGHIPPYDANLVRLVETERQGYCAGVTFWKTQGNGEAGQARACRKEHQEQSGRINMVAAERGFCQGIVDSGWLEGGVADCLSILGSYQYWPTYDGSISSDWNRARPYPRPALSTGATQDDGSRTGGRGGGPGRDSPSRPGYDYYDGGTP